MYAALPRDRLVPFRRSDRSKESEVGCLRLGNTPLGNPPLEARIGFSSRRPREGGKGGLPLSLGGDRCRA